MDQPPYGHHPKQKVGWKNRPWRFRPLPPGGRNSTASICCGMSSLTISMTPGDLSSKELMLLLRSRHLPMVLPLKSSARAASTAAKQCLQDIWLLDAPGSPSEGPIEKPIRPRLTGETGLNPVSTVGAPVVKTQAKTGGSQEYLN